MIRVASHLYALVVAVSHHYTSIGGCGDALEVGELAALTPSRP